MKNLILPKLNPNRFGFILLFALMVACADYENDPTLSVDDSNLLALSTTQDGPLVEPTLRTLNFACDTKKFSETMPYNPIMANGEFESEFPEGFELYSDGSFISWYFTPYLDENGKKQTLGEVEVKLFDLLFFELSVYSYEVGFFSDFEILGDSGLYSF